MKVFLINNLKVAIQSYFGLLQLLSQRRKMQIFFLLVLSILSAISEVANIGILIPFLGILADAKNNIDKLGFLGEYFSNLPPHLLLPVLSFIFICLIVLSTSIRSFTITNQFHLGSLICADIGRMTFNSILSRSYESHLQGNSSNVISLLTQDVERVGAIVKGILSLCVNSLIIGIVGIFLLSTSLQIMLTAIVSLCLFYIIIYQSYRKDFSEAGRERTYNYRKSVKVIQESLGSIRELILDNHYDLFVDSYDNYNRNRFLYDAKILIKASIPRYLVEGFLIVVVTSIALVYVMSGNELYDLLPTLAAVILGVYKLMQPIQVCFNTIGTLQANQAPLLELQKYINLTDSPKKKTDSILRTNKSNNRSTTLIRFVNVSFRYQNHDRLVLKDINFSIEKGESVALVGFTGSGKSTLSDLLLGLLKPSTGNIFVDNTNLHHDQAFLDIWQQRIAHVPQSIFLSDTDIESNIAYGVANRDIIRSRLHLAAQQASIHTFIESLSNGYQTSVGERGISLSGGQRQRIGIARALYKQSELLVLDEATSALDNLTEKVVMNSIKSLNESVTLFLIAHRLSTIMHCDRIILLDKGKVECIGKYDELLANSPLFRNFVTSASYDCD